MKIKKICFVIGSRANYSSIKSVLIEVKKNKKLKLQLVIGASAVLDKYGTLIDQIRKDGFKPDVYLNTIIEGNTPLVMAKSTGLGLIEIPSAFEKLKPDIVFTIGDRFETMSTVLSAAYMNIPIAHSMGGEVSGNIDESIRHAITKFSHIHFPASKDAYKRILKLGEDKKTVQLVGCPRIDIVSKILKNKSNLSSSSSFNSGVGDKIDFSAPFFLVSFHPITSEFGMGQKQMKNILEAIKFFNYQSIILWPNPDAGSEDVARSIRKWREKKLDKNMHFFKNLKIDDYIFLMSKTKCLIGNSSSGIREGAFIGTPVVNIGSRQNGRERSKNVIDTDYSIESIKSGIKKQLNHGKYKSDSTYGNGNSAIKIVNFLIKLKKIKTQKKILF